MSKQTNDNAQLTASSVHLAFSGVLAIHNMTFSATEFRDEL